jgi:hypothetical protein
MFRTSSMAALALALMSSAALAQSGPVGRADGPPSQMSGANNSYYDDRDDGPPPVVSNQAPGTAQEQRSRDIFCRRDAAARTGYVTPGQAARDSKTNAQVGGTLGGAALGAVVGSASHSAGVGALIGAGAGLIAGTAIGSDNAHHAAADVEHAYSDAYYACMDEADDRGPLPGDRDYAYGPPPSPVYGPAYGPVYGPAYYAPYPYYYPPYYGPSVSLGFGFGGYHGWRGGHRGFHR